MSGERSKQDIKIMLFVSKLFIPSLRGIQKSFIDKNWLIHYSGCSLRLLGEFMQPELKVRKILGRTYLNENRLAEALDVFIQILKDYPDDLETLLILGGCYLAGGDGKTARNLYLRAQQLDPSNKTIERQIMLAEEMVDVELADSIPTDMESVSRLLQRLTGESKAVDERDILQAANLLDKIINSESPAELVSAHLDEIDGLLQALIEVNIRQARADGRTDIADGLQNLQLNIDYQLVAKDSHKTSQHNPDSQLESSLPANLLMLLPDIEHRSNRMALLKSAMESFGCRVTEKTEFVSGRDPEPDLVITSNPHTNPVLIKSLSMLSTKGIPILLDLDTNFKDQPVSHSEYARTGLSTQARSNDFALAISLADLISVPSWSLASTLSDLSDRVFVIPDGWSRQNKLWAKAPAPHNMVNIGWVSTSGELEDIMLIRRYITRVIREFPNTRVVIIGNPQAYRLFDNLPENRRMYIPLVAHEEFPYLLSQLDVLVVPLQNSPYNLSTPDTILMQAGARCIPWISSSVPSFSDWSEGGILIESIDDEWHLSLRHLIMDAELRTKLGKAGRDAARTREMENVSKLWLEAVSLLTTKNKLSLQKMETVKNTI